MYIYIHVQMYNAHTHIGAARQRQWQSKGPLDVYSHVCILTRMYTHNVHICIHMLIYVFTCMCLRVHNAHAWTGAARQRQWQSNGAPTWCPLSRMHTHIMHVSRMPYWQVIFRKRALQLVALLRCPLSRMYTHNMHVSIHVWGGFG